MKLNWKKIWIDKGKATTDDLLVLDGYENTNINAAFVAEKIQHALGVDTNCSVLEVGCGAGMLAQFFNCDYTGIDYSETLIEKHKFLLGNNVFIADANKLPFDNNVFDCVFSYSVFQYFPSKEYAKKTIKEICRVSKGPVFIGDLPRVSHDLNHLLYTKEEFPGWETSCGFYNKDRFNIYRKEE